jgi:hypothetical protein
VLETILLLFLQITRILPVIGAALLGFFLAPLIKRKRVTTALAAALLVVLWNDVYFAELGVSSWRWALLLPLAAIAVGPWIVAPLRALRKPVKGTPTPTEPYDPARHPLAPVHAEWAARTVAALQAEEFAVVDDVVMLSSDRKTRRLLMLDHGENALRALVFAGPRGPLSNEREGHVSFYTVLADGRWVIASNADDSGTPPRADPKVVGLRLRDEADPMRVLHAFRVLVRATPGSGERSLPPGATAAEFFAHNTREFYERMVALGWMRPASGGFRYTLRGAVLSHWLHVFPLRQIESRRARRRQDAEMARLGLPVPPRSELAGTPGWWISYGGMNVAGAALALLLGVAWPALADRGGLGGIVPLMASAREDSVAPARLPDGFAVPGDFPGAVRALERLAGARARPLTADDGFSGAPSAAMMVPVDSGRVEPLLAAAQPVFAANGFVLFHTQEFDGVHGEPEALALLPSRDPFSLVLTLNTNGGNYGIGPEEVAAWLREVDRDHPLTLTSAGFDYVEGRFRRPLSNDDARALAVRVARFCPDVVTQGTGTVRALAEEMHRTRTLYCWWD